MSQRLARQSDGVTGCAPIHNHRRVPQVAFKPDWTRHGKAAPFKRSDQMLEVMPIGVVVFPGTGIQDNLADQAKKLGIPQFDVRRGGA